jgi:ppGpp synthetase/RelA/SpoT-type nucleotidyltranferase
MDSSYPMSFNEIRAAFLADQEKYERLCNWAKDRLTVALLGTRTYSPTVTGRAKDIVSFLRKIMRKSYDDPMTQITDRAGVRVLVTFKQDIAIVEAIIRDLFSILERTDMAARLDEDQLGYLGIHYVVTPKEDDDRVDHDLLGLAFEVQIHSRAESAWAMASHRILYKPIGGTPSRSIERRINRLVALVELFDQELTDSWQQIVSTPRYQQGAMLFPLEQQYLTLPNTDVGFDEAALIGDPWSDPRRIHR